jgi:hypothetical protein
MEQSNITQNAVKESPTRKSPTRKFGGSVITKDNYREILNQGGRDLINFHNKHLKAYLNGKTFFYHGRDAKGEKILRIVQQKFEN